MLFTIVPPHRPGRVIQFPCYNHFMSNLALVSIIIIALMLAYGCYYVVILTLKAHKHAIVSGQEAIIGAEGVVVSVHRDKIVVSILGELWAAECNHPLHINQAIKVIKLKGLLVTVKPIESKEKIC